MNKTILVVDNNIIDELPRVFLAQDLRDAGYNIVQAGCHDRALQVYKEQGADAVVHDWDNNKNDNDLFVSKIRQLAPILPIIILADSRVQLDELHKKFTPSDVRGASDAPYLDLLKKPFHTKELITKIESIFGPAKGTAPVVPLRSVKTLQHK